MMDLHETTVLKEINQDLNGELLSSRKNNTTNNVFSTESLKENNNKINSNLDKTFEQENFNFADFEDKTIDNSNSVSVCEVNNNQGMILEEQVSEDKYLVRNPVNDTTIAGYSSDEETFAECNSYIAPEPKENLASSSDSRYPNRLNENIVEKSSKLSLTNLNFENLKIDDHEDLDKTTNVIVDDCKSEEEEECIADNNELNETFTPMPDQNIKPIEFEEFGIPIGHLNQSVNENFEFASDSSLCKDRLTDTKSIPSSESTMGKKTQEKDSGIFLENFVQNSFSVEFKVPDAPTTANLMINQRWCPPNLVNHFQDDMVPGNEFNFDAGAFDIFDNKSELGNIPQRENSLLLRFDPLLNKPVSVQLDVQTVPPIAEEEYSDEIKSVRRCSETRKLLDITLEEEKSEVDQSSSNEIQGGSENLNDTLSELQVRSPPKYDTEGIEVGHESKTGELESIKNKTEKNTRKSVHCAQCVKEEGGNSRKSVDCAISVLEEVPTTRKSVHCAQCAKEEGHNTKKSVDCSISVSEEVTPNTRKSVNCHLCASEEVQSRHETMSVHIGNDLETANEDDPVIGTINLQQHRKEECKMAEIQKKFKNQGIKSEDNDRKLKEFESREEALIKRISEKEKVIAKMNSVVEAYETTISELISEKAQITQRYEKKYINLRETAQLNESHLLSLEDTFSDLHTKYERSKQMAINLKQNEEKLMAESKQLKDLLATQEVRYEKMKSHAMSQLQVANFKLENVSKNHAQEVSKLKALLKKEEIARTALADQLQQKIRENEEIVKICEELIGGGNAASENS